MTQRTEANRPAWWGSRSHVIFTIVVFIILASLDNTALALVPSMLMPIATELNTSESALGFLTGSVILVAALTAVVWGYQGDRGNRKTLLFWGTMVWAAGSLLSASSGSYRDLFIFQVITAVGLGSIASVGFSVVSDLIAPRRRGLAMSFWGLSQGVGGFVGGLVASQLGAGDFRTPLMVVAVAGFVFAVLYLATFDAPRGYREPELQPLFERGEDYEHRIDRDALTALWQRPTNRWLIIQGFTAQIAYGSLIWVTFLYQAKVEAAGFSEATATRVGGLLAAVFQFGALFSILAGHLGDRWQTRTLRARAIISAVGISAAIPFFLAFFFLPLRGLDVTEGAGTMTLLPEVLRAMVTNPWVAGAFVSSILALALTSADSPNWFALISDVNVPEHRGTVFGLGNLSNGIGRSIGNALTGLSAARFETMLAPPWNWAVGLAMFQVFFLPTGYCYWRASRTSPHDIIEVRELLHSRAGPDQPGGR